MQRGPTIRLNTCTNHIIAFRGPDIAISLQNAILQVRPRGGPKRPLVPGFPVTLKSTCVIGTVQHVARLPHAAFRASAGSWNTNPETHERKGFIHRCCECLQIGVPLILSRGHTSTPRLRGTTVMVKIWGTQNDTKNDPQQNVCTSLAGSYSSPRATTAREIEGRSWPAVVGSQKRLMRCFREFELASSNTKSYRNH